MARSGPGWGGGGVLGPARLADRQVTRAGVGMPAEQAAEGGGGVGDDRGTVPAPQTDTRQMGRGGGGGEGVAGHGRLADDAGCGGVGWSGEMRVCGWYQQGRWTRGTGAKKEPRTPRSRGRMASLTRAEWFRDGGLEFYHYPMGSVMRRIYPQATKPT
jgi:hypothetical protein